MIRKILFAIVLFTAIFLVVFTTSGVTKFFRVSGNFLPNSTWSGGYPGRILFDIGASNSSYYAGVDADGYLSGYFWLGNVGWTTFNHGIDPNQVPRARVLCPNNVFNNTSIICPLEGFAWSQNAGWIALSGSWIDNGQGLYASGAYFNPSTGRIEGYAHSRSLGWIPFYAQASPITPVATTSQTGILFNGVGLNFIGRIAIIGNIAGTRIYNVATQQVGFVFSSIGQADMLNIIRRNIALLTRNVPDSELSDPSANGLDFLVIRGSDYDTSGGGWTWPATKRSIIVIGGDVILGGASGDSHVQIGLPTSADRAIIALKDESGYGGNIIVDDSIGRIYGLLYAEGTIYSGEKVGSIITPYVTSGAWNIPGNQLYIKGAMISKNTIGGSLQSPPVCPVVVNECNVSNSQVYDINYFRTYDPNDPNQRNVPYNDPRFANAAGVIEYNPDLALNPPPGIQNIFQ